MNAAVHSTVLTAAVTLALSLLSGSAGAQADWQTGSHPTSYAATDAASWYPPATVARGDLLRLPVVDEPAFAPLARFDSSVQPADYVPEMNEAADDLPPDAQFYTIEELREEMKKLAWTKGDFTIVPYGQLWGSALYATERASPGSFVTHVFSSTLEGEDDFVIDTRRTRLGLNIAGPDIPLFGCAKSGAQVEVDFYGGAGQIAGNSAVLFSENRASILLRHAYAEVKTENWRVLAGQYWDLMSPLLPGTVSYSVGWGGGNVGFRRMQVRGERYLHVSDTCLVSLQGAVAQDIISDSLVLGETANWPVLEWRTGLTLGDRSSGSHPVTMGVSGHAGEQGFDFPAIDDDRIPTWSLNADCRVPIGDRLGIQGEFFTGKNLSTILGGSLQGINLLTREPIQSTGGWFDVWFDWTPRLHTHLGYGIDNPQNSDIAPGGRTYNHFLFANVFFDVTKKLNFGFEVSNWNTYYQDGVINNTYVDLAPGKAVVFEFAGNYGF
jgi:hypothetical protein